MMSWRQEANGRLIISAELELPMTEEFKIIFTPGENPEWPDTTESPEVTTSSATALSACFLTFVLAFLNH